MTTTPRVSVVVLPDAPDDATLDRALTSVLAQEGIEFEVLLSQTGTANNVAGQLAERDDRLHIVPGELERAVSRARGAYIALQDPSTISLPGRLASQLVHLAEHPELGVLGGQLIHEAAGRRSFTDLPLTHDEILWELLFDDALPAATVMLRRELWPRLADVAPGHGAWSRRTVLRTEVANLDAPLVRRCPPEDDQGSGPETVELRRELAATLLERPISSTLFTWLARSQSDGRRLEDWQVRQVLALLVELEGAVRARPTTRHPELLRQRLAGRLLRASRAPSRWAESIAPEDVTSAFFRLHLPEPLFHAGRTLRHPLITWRRWQKERRRSVDPPSSSSPPPSSSPTALPEPAEPSTTVQTTRPVTARQPLAEDGLTVIVLSYERMAGLAALLESLLAQDLKGMGLELLCCNNSPRERLVGASESRLTELFARFPDVKIFDSGHNWKCEARYALATLARHQTVLFLDDDVVLHDPSFLTYMVETWQGLEDIDILSAWTSLWVSWDGDELCEVQLNFKTAELVAPTEIDVAGPGIAMFDRRLLLESKVWDVVRSREFPGADDMAFSLAASLACGSRSYALPSHGMLSFHDEWRHGALYHQPGHNEILYAQYKALLAEGYRPVLSREGPGRSRSADLARRLPVKTFAW